MAVSDLEAARAAFADLGLATDYGGAHSNGVTHMALLGFDDGSYVELISTLQAGALAPWWGRFIAADAGPCGWAISPAADVASEASRIAAQGIPVDGPRPMSRYRPDGSAIHWDQAFVGEDLLNPGAVLPFVIRDRTPREWRVSPSPSVSGSELSGVSRVVLAVRDPAATARLFAAAFGWVEPIPVGVDDALGADLFVFEDKAVILAAPSGPESRVAERLAEHGDSPIACLIESTDFDLTSRRLPLGAEIHGLGRQARWLDSPVPALRSLGVIAA